MGVGFARFAHLNLPTAKGKRGGWGEVLHSARVTQLTGEVG